MLFSPRRSLVFGAMISLVLAHFPFPFQRLPRRHGWRAGQLSNFDALWVTLRRL
jgi:hypothetical protein